MNLNQIKFAKDGDELHDDDVRGLQLRVKGERKTFCLYYRTKAGQRRRPKIGEFPAMTLAKAREVARELLGLVALGQDPSADWPSSREAETMSELCDRYLADYAREHKRTAWRDEQRINNVIRPRWGNQPAVGITKEDVMGLRRAMKDIPVTFNRTRSMLSKMFNFAEIEPNPVKRVPRFRETPRRRYLNPEEYIRLAKALDDLEAQYPHAIGFLRLLLLTGCRSGELLNARREWFRDGVLTLPVHKTFEKTGAKEILFPPSAKKVLQALEPRNGWLCGLNSRPTIVIDLVVGRAELENFVPHDIRHSFASEALSAGYTLDQIAELFGHASVETTRRYAHLIHDKKRQAAVDISRQMEMRLSAKR